MKNWDRILEQTVIKLKLLCPSRLNPKHSANAQFHGTFDYKINLMPHPRHQKPSVPQTAEQEHLGTTQLNIMVCMSCNATLLISFIIHNQDSIGTSLRHNGTLPSAKEIHKPFTIRYGNTRGSWPHRSPPESSSIPQFVEKQRFSLKQPKPILNMAVPQETSPPCTTSWGGTNTWSATTERENTTTRHNSASETCATSEGDQKIENHYDPRASKRSTIPYGNLPYLRWHRRKTTTTLPMWCNCVQRSTVKHI